MGSWLWRDVVDPFDYVVVREVIYLVSRYLDGPGISKSRFMDHGTIVIH